ncbi:hypothetical protein [Mycobacterium rhizamassiliense]|uniref:hypothetical protein n=1 Tax=Mycobacterium rhizamassiliense TaxID=1841860 RepID=UPI001FEB24BA|nr:hypothetical protein [Mycobacterium rhizamassiliense]
MATASEKNPEPKGLVDSIGRGLARLRETRLDLQTTPLREMRLELQIVFFAIKTPLGAGTTVRIPALVMLRRVGSSDLGQLNGGPVQDDN